ncbi:hypothetical protein M422DRAFT_778075 [Sphaerobolus stellatus SS14]|nr:hypothetical protein M422DRAFT_778075 [Sphaerobolus stellatus SS14]
MRAAAARVGTIKGDAENFYDGLTRNQVKNYRACQMFPLEDVILNTFTFDKRRVWLQPDAYNLSLRRDENGLGGSSVDIGDEPGARLEASRKFILPTSMHTDAFFSPEHVDVWVKDAPYFAFLTHVYPSFISTHRKTCKTPIHSSSLVFKEEEPSY